MLVRQHLIDPEICIRCNTCEDLCPTKAISHDRRNYAIASDLCDACGRCLPPCPTGAIDSWRRVARPHPVSAQLQWDSLPQDEAPAAPGTEPLPPEVARITTEAADAGVARPPWSAAHPYLNLYTPERPARTTVSGNHRLTAEDASCAIHHIVLDLGRTAFPVLEGQSVGVLPPGLGPDGQRHKLRLYSVASPRTGERHGYNNLALTVKRVTADRAGNPVRGVASNYLCDLRKGDEVELTGPYGATFLMPNHPGARLLMICTGTGAAPMRAMTERRRRRRGRGEGGDLMLFFGARTPGELPYFGPLMRLPRELIDVNLALSRVPGEPRRYVQDLLRERADAVLERLLDEDCYIYLCGLKHMEEGVHGALAEIAARAGRSWDALLPALRETGRFHAETY